MEKHYRIEEIAELIGFSRWTVTRMFENEPGIFVRRVNTGKRSYRLITVPDSVVQRVLDRDRLREANPGQRFIKVKFEKLKKSKLKLEPLSKCL